MDSRPPLNTTPLLMRHPMRRADRSYSLTGIRKKQAYKPVGVGRGSTCWYSITDCTNPCVHTARFWDMEPPLTSISQVRHSLVCTPGPSFYMMIIWYSHCVTRRLRNGCRRPDHLNKSDLMRYVWSTLFLKIRSLTASRLKYLMDFIFRPTELQSQHVRANADRMTSQWPSLILWLAIQHHL